VNVAIFKENMQSLDSNYETITAKDTMSKQKVASAEEAKGMQRASAVRWDFSKGYITLDKYYHYRNSRVFEAIFSQMAEAASRPG
jgi:hypothetical protein